MPDYQGPERRRRARPAKPPEEQRTEKVETYLSPGMAASFREAVSKEGLTVSHALRQMCRQYLKARGITAI